MDFWIMKEDKDGCHMGLHNPLGGSVLHPRDKYGPYVRSEDVNVILAERDSLAAENAELKRRLDAVLAALRPAQIKWSKSSMDSPEYHAWCLIVPLYGQAVAIAEGRDNG